jgi:hypothetical protein
MCNFDEMGSIRGIYYKEDTHLQTSDLDFVLNG